MEIGESGAHGPAAKVCLVVVTDSEADRATILLLQMVDLLAEVQAEISLDALDVQVIIN